MNRLLGRTWICAVCFLVTSAVAFGQSTNSGVPSNTDGRSGQQTEHQTGPAADVPDTPSPNDTQNKVVTLPQAIFHDQIGMWTSPSRVRYSDATWLVPLGGLAAAFFVTDSDFSRQLSAHPNTQTNYRHISEYGAYSMAGGAAGTYFLGLLTHNEHERESGFLSGQAAIDSLIAVEAIKVAAGRQRPYQDNGDGTFWKGGSSFPSEHAAGAWAIAGIMAHEYPSPFMKLLAYGMASTVSFARIGAKQHFPSDVLVGAAIGYLTSEYVYRKHHKPELMGSAWEFPAVQQGPRSNWPVRFMGSPYVPLDSWIYPALERLAALGYVNSAIAGMRPWTRMECARQLGEAADRITDADSVENEAARLHRQLAQEFSREMNLLGGGDNAQVRMESAYTRVTEIAGKPLTDGYHFGQTIYNDFGRPEEQGFNNVTGLSGWAAAGPFAAYVNAEFQHSPSAPALPLAARNAIALADFGRSIVPQPWPVQPDTPTPAVNRARLLDTYVAMNLSNWQLSYGKQSLKWGPDEGGGMMLSDNADPLSMFRINRVTPFKLPSFLGVLGPMRVEFFLGQYAGYEFMFTPAGLVGRYGRSLHPQPIVHGERFSFKPTTNFEFGMSRTTDYGGPNYPLTWHTFLRSVFSRTETIPGAADKPGSRRSGLDFSYRFRGLTFYADGMTEHDTVSPIIAFDVAAWLGGIYIPRLPGISKMDFRAEGVYTDPPIGGNVGSGFFYYNPTWISGFTNSGNLMGHWAGREGQGVQAWTTYWFTPRNKLQFEFRHLKVSHEFINGGGTLTDGSIRGDFWVRSSFSLSAVVQYETWTFPVIAVAKQSNVSTSIQLSLWPRGFASKGGE